MFAESAKKHKHIAIAVTVLNTSFKILVTTSELLVDESEVVV